MLWGIFALVSALLWTFGTVWSMIADFKAISGHKQELLEGLNEISRERADAKLGNRPFLTKGFTLVRDLLEVKYLWEGSEAFFEAEARAIRVHQHKALAWLTLCLAGITGVIAAGGGFSQ